jgi:hypothetical protein
MQHRRRNNTLHSRLVKRYRRVVDTYAGQTNVQVP